MWTRLNQTHGLSVRRSALLFCDHFDLGFSHSDTAMMMLSIIDPVGSENRKRRKLQRRVYRSKVFLKCSQFE